jgi:glycosyltransferase involved in cell wall biosynthesis
MRALHVLNGLDPKLGGPPVAVRNMVVAAAREGVEVELAACDVGGEYVAEARAALAEEGVTLESFSITGTAEPLVRWGASLPMLQYLWRRAPSFDVVHVHGAWSITSLGGALRPRLAGRPTVLTPHETLTDFDIDVARSRWRTRQKRVLGAGLLRLVDVVVFSSEIERRDSPIAAAADVRVLAHPVVDQENHDPAPPRSGEGFRVGFFGRLHPKKNLPVLLEAVAGLPGVTLSVAGSGPEESAYRNQADSLGLTSRAQWLGFISGDTKREFLGSIDVLAMPSQYECFGLAAAEALEAGVPVVVSDTVGIAPAVSQYGAGLVTRRDPTALSAAIARLRDDPALLDRCRSGAIRAATEAFSFKTFGAGIRAIYAELVERNAAG